MTWKPTGTEWHWPILYRETGIIEYTCEHGVGHPTKASAIKVATYYNDQNESSLEDNISSWMVHGCDGCCQLEHYPEYEPEEEGRMAAVEADFGNEMESWRNAPTQTELLERIAEALEGLLDAVSPPVRKAKEK